MLTGLGTSCGSNATTDATTPSSTAVGAAPTSTTAPGAGAASGKDFCALPAAQAVELGKRLRASATAAAASTPEFKAASDRYLAWVNKNCSADQASQIVGMGAGK